jgi:hypothetical protein
MRDIQFQFAHYKRVADQQLADLVVIADWQDDLLSRIRRAQLRFEFIGLDADEQEALATEVAAFKQVCIALTGAPLGLDHYERSAA